MIAAADCIRLVRDLLNDSNEPYRWSDAKLLPLLNQSLDDLFLERPDLRLDSEGTFVGEARFESVGGTVFLDVKYEAAVALGCAARAFEFDNSDTANLALADRFLARAKMERMK